MPQVAPAQSEVLSPQAQLIQMAWAHQVSSLVRVAAELKLADHLAEGPKSAEQLAQLTATHAPALYRVMRTLASLGLFTEDERHCFALTPLGEPLRSGTPGSVRNSVLTMTGDMFCRPLANLLYSVQTGKTGFGKAFGAEIFDWLPHHPEEAAMFSDLMVGFHGPETAAVAAAYDLLEMVLPAGDIPHTGKMTDIVMLTVPGGQERTELEYGQLLKKGGFKLARVVPTESAASIVEAFPA